MCVCALMFFVRFCIACFDTVVPPNLRLISSIRKGLQIRRDNWSLKNKWKLLKYERNLCCKKIGNHQHKVVNFFRYFIFSYRSQISQSIEAYDSSWYFTVPQHFKNIYFHQTGSTNINIYFCLVDCCWHYTSCKFTLSTFLI